MSTIYRILPTTFTVGGGRQPLQMDFSKHILPVPRRVDSMTLKFPSKKIRWLVFGSIVCGWLMIWAVDKGLELAFPKVQPDVYYGELPVEYTVNASDARKSTVVLLYSKSHSLGITKLGPQVTEMLDKRMENCSTDSLLFSISNGSTVQSRPVL